ncbi:MAG: lipopolysaccharide biosynthesis protein [Kiritimatiellae bacterium]|jgi:lipopolysaccharide exporter|nr:lipopolysaccharide biosynthesis protein [Kiritimatiellia bacterium]
MPSENKTIGRKIFIGTLWTSGMRMSLRFLGIISMIILARLLDPTDFGLVAKATMIQGFLYSITELGLESALIRDQEATKDHYNTVWTVHILRGILIGIALAALASPASIYLHEPRLEAIIYCYAVLTLFGGFYNIGVVDFRKDMNFSYDFKYNLYRKLTSFVVTLAVAITWETYWALIAGVAADLLMSIFASFLLSKYRPKISLLEWKSLYGFSKWLLGHQLLVAVSTKIDTFLLSRYSTTANVGLYTIAFEMAGTPSTEIAMPAARASLPGLAKLSHDINQFSAMYLRILSTVFMVSIPAATGVCLLSDQITMVILGSKWVDAIPFIQILAFFGLVRVVNATASSALIAFNRPDVLTKVGAVKTILRVVILSLCLYYFGTMGMVWGVLIVGFLGTAILLYIQNRLGVLPFMQLVGLTWRFILSTGIMTIGLYPLHMTKVLLVEMPMIFRLLLEILSGATLYSVSLLFLWYFFSKGDGPEDYVLQKIFKNKFNVAP